MSEPYKIYIPAGAWVVENLTSYCVENNIANADIQGIGSITDIWTLVNPNGSPIVKNFSAGPSYEMTSLIGNVTLRQGAAIFNKSSLPAGTYPEFDTSVTTFNPYVHVHVTFANPDMSISGGHLLDTQASIGVELVVRPMAGEQCVIGLRGNEIPSNCVSDQAVTVEPYGTMYNWDRRFWYPAPRTA